MRYVKAFAAAAAALLVIDIAWISLFLSDVCEAQLGAVAYGTYTLTNYAIFAQWSVLLVVSDIGWGTCLTAVCAVVGYLAAREQNHGAE